MNHRDANIRSFSRQEEPDSAAEAVDLILSRLEAIENRLARLEKFPVPPETPREHPSRDRFGQDADAGAGEFKICTFESGGKICDHCLMCSTRGF